MNTRQFAQAMSPGGSIRRAIDREILEVQRELTVDLYARIKGGWPRDTGESRENVLPWANTPDRRVVVKHRIQRGQYSTPRPVSQSEIQEAAGVLALLRPSKPSGVVHNGVEAAVIEFGRFRGSGPRTIGGYSTQAPAGVFRVGAASVVATWNARLRRRRLGVVG